MTNELNNTINNSNESELKFKPENTAPQFKLDAAQFEVDIDASSDPTKPRIATAILGKRDHKLLVKRDAMTSTELVEANATEDELVVENERGNSWLFDQLVKKVKGYRLKGESPEVAESLREPSPELLKAIYPSHKSKFIENMEDVSAKLVEDDDEFGIVLGGGDILEADLTIGNEDNPIAVIRFSIPEPEETERRNYKLNATKIRQPKGSRKSRNRIVANLDKTVKFFDELMLRDGAEIGMSPDFADSPVRVTVGGKTFSELSSVEEKRQFLSAIDGIYKRHILSAVMSKYNAKVLD